jgi:hypothetical protein
MHGKVLVGAAKTGNKVVFPAADGSFCCVLSMNARRDELVGSVVEFHEAFESRRSFIVKLLEEGLEATVREKFVYFGVAE